MIGSFAAIIVDPVTQVTAAIKAGSSLYVGKGFSKEKGAFTVISSDLGSVLSLTRILIPIAAGEFALFTADTFSFYSLSEGVAIMKTPVRSRLKVEETRLHEPYKFFMAQEIAAQVPSSHRLIDLFMGTSLILEPMRIIQGLQPDLVKNIKRAVDNLSEITDMNELKSRLEILKNSEDIQTLRSEALKLGLKDLERQKLESSLATFLEEIKVFFPSRSFDFEARLIDSIFFLDEVCDIERRITDFVDLMVRAYEYGSTVYLLACGTSCHAAKTAALFFNMIPGLNIYPLLPGEFRAQYSRSIRDRDVIIGISQSGETKDLIDIFNMAEQSGKEVNLISIVNNINSTLALEKSELFIPLFCGPEISVPATKSFMNQLLVLYILALRIAKRFSDLGIKKIDSSILDKYTQELYQVPDLIGAVIRNCDKEITRIAGELFLEPSMHILATGMLGIAKEGALKIREVVLNHTEGFEGAEFKHGPNTILGVNTIFGMQSLKSVVGKLSRAVNSMLKDKTVSVLDAARGFKILKAVADNTFSGRKPHNLDDIEMSCFEKIVSENDFFESLYTNYPLIFITGPAKKDVHLTISQINTHKIRGANVYIIAEESSDLEDAITSIPDTKFKVRFKNGYIRLPKTDSEVLTVFSSTAALQCLALKMSILKMEYLDRLGIIDHGVHPDSPKNVSKSITVD
jgi:glucosamine 6-phosphate synthetase-like amidotransferase/phosphosugar isomerase protein